VPDEQGHLCEGLDRTIFSGRQPGNQKGAFRTGKGIIAIGRLRPFNGFLAIWAIEVFGHGMIISLRFSHFLTLCHQSRIGFSGNYITKSGSCLWFDFFFWFGVHPLKSEQPALPCLTLFPSPKRYNDTNES
jgi:hypothetical protein